MSRRDKEDEADVGNRQLKSLFSHEASTEHHPPFSLSIFSSWFLRTFLFLTIPSRSISLPFLLQKLCLRSLRSPLASLLSESHSDLLPAAVRVDPQLQAVHPLRPLRHPPPRQLLLALCKVRAKEKRVHRLHLGSPLLRAHLRSSAGDAGRRLVVHWEPH